MINAGTQNAIDQTYRVFYLQEVISDTSDVIVFNSQGDILHDAFTVPAADGFIDRAIFPVTFGANMVTSNGKKIGTVKKITAPADPILGFYNGDPSFAPNEAPLRYANVQLAAGFNITPGVASTALAYGAAVKFTGDVNGPADVNGNKKYPVVAATGSDEPTRKSFVLEEVLAADVAGGAFKIVDIITL